MVAISRARRADLARRARDIRQECEQQGMGVPQVAQELLMAYQHAPAEVRDRPSIRRIAAELVERHPRTPGVRRLAALASPA